MFSPSRKEGKILSANSNRVEIPYNVHEQHFAVRHHDTVGPFVEILLGVFTTCQWDKTGSHVVLEDAHDHVFGNKDLEKQPCDWCLSTFQHRRDYQKEFFA